MSRTIDERVVEMRFDNNQFESGVKETLNSLKSLKESLKLDDAAKSFESLDKAANSVDLKGIASGIEALEQRFSTLGIVGMRVIENITDSLMGTVSNAISYVTDSIISGGMKRAQNIENAHFQLQALLKDEEKVQAVMDDAMASVDGTAYAYDEAAKAAAQFSASGLQAGEEMQNALKGITGVAAMTNSEYEGISRIFTTVAGNGRLMGDQLLQLSSRGLNAASTIADYYKEVRGQSDMTEAKIREMVSAGKISFETFAEAMNWAFGESAFRANETFTGALSNMQSALARIGAGFFSPLIEQNSDLILLINSLRVRINDVKKSLVFDEETSAVSGLSKEMKLMSDTVGQLVTSGKMDFSEFTSTILAATNTTHKSEEELAEVNDKLAKSYESVKESGVVTIDTLKEFKSNGIDASKALSQYINGVIDGSVKASDATKSAINELTNGTKITTVEINKLANEGKLSYELFTDAIINSSGAIAAGTQIASDAVSNLLAKVKEQGSVSMDTIKEFRDNGVSAAKALVTYMNGVTDGSIRTTYALRTSIFELTGDAKITSAELYKMAEEGTISYSILQAAMENMYGDQKALSKQFSEWFLDTVKNLSKWIDDVDLSTPMEVMYYNFESLKNIVNGVISLIKPLGRAFSNVFLKNASADGIVSIAAKLEELTSKMTLSQKASKNLYDAFKGVFDIISLLIRGFASLFGVVVPIAEPVGTLSDSILELLGTMGRGLSSIAEWIDNCTVLQKAHDLLAKSFQTGSAWVKKGIGYIVDFAKKVYGMVEVQNILEGIGDAFDDFSNTVADKVQWVMDKLSEFKDWVEEKVPDYVSQSLQDLFDILADGFRALSNADISGVTAAFSKFIDKIKEVGNALLQNQGIQEFIKNAKNYRDQVTDAFTMDKATTKINNFKSVLTDITSFIRDKVAPIFSDVSLGGIVAVLGGGGIIYTLNKGMKAFEKLGDSVNKIASPFAALKDVIKSYQQDLKADYIVKIAGALTLLAVALTVLSFADTERVYAAAVALGLIGGALISAAALFVQAINKFKSVPPALDSLAAGVAKSLNNLAKAVKWKAIGKAFLNIGESIALIAGSIIAIAVMYGKDEANMNKAVKLVGIIVAAAVGIAALFALLNKKLNSSNIKNLKGNGKNNTNGNSMGSSSDVGKIMLEMAASLYLITLAINKLFKIKIPSDYRKRLTILENMIGGMIALALVAAIAARIAKGNNLKANGVISMAAGLYVMVSAIGKLFKIDIPNDYKKRLEIVEDLLKELCAIIVVMALASRLSKTGLKGGAGTILAMCVAIGTITLSLGVLTLFPAEKLKKGAEALAVVLLGLAGALYGSGKIASKDSWKSVLAMAIMVGVIVVALGVLSMISWEDLAKGAASLGVVLLAVGKSLDSASKIQNTDQLLALIAAMALVVVVADALQIISDQPWENMLASGVAMGITLVAVGKALDSISGSSGLTWKKALGTFLNALALLAPITAALVVLGNFGGDWKDILAGAVGMGIVLNQLADTLEVVSSRKGLTQKKALGTFLNTLAILAPITAALAVLGNFGGDAVTMIAGAASMSLVLLALSKAFEVISDAKDISTEKAASFLISSAATIAIGASLVIIDGIPWTTLLPGAVAISAVLIALATAFKIIGSSQTVSDDQAMSFLKSSLSVVVIGFALMLIQDVPWQNLLAGATAISAVLLSLGASFKIMGSIDKLDDSIIEGLMVGCIAIIAIGAALWAAAQNPWQSLLAAGAAISGVLLALSEAFKIMSTIPTVTSGMIGSVLLGCVAVAAIGFVLYEVAKQDWQSLLAAAAAVSGTLLSISGVMVICSEIGPLAGPALEGLGVLDLFIADLIAITAVIGGLFEKFEQLESAFDKGGEILVRLGEYLGEFIGNIIGNALDSIFSSMPDWGTNLSGFANNIGDFIDTMKTVDQDVVDGAGRLFAAITALVAGEFLDAISSLIGIKNMDSLKDTLQGMGAAVKAFDEETANINPRTITAASTAAKTLVELYNILPREGGIAEKLLSGICGDTVTMDEFSDLLSSFGSAVAAYSQIVDGKINASAVEASVNAGKAVLGLYESMPKQNGWAQAIFGEQEDLKTFGTELVSFGIDLVKYSMIVDGNINQSAIEASKAAAEIVLELYNDMPSVGGIIQDIFGSQETLDEFGSELISFGIDLVKYSDIVSTGNLDNDAISQSADAAANLVSLSNSLNTSGGLSGLIFGDSSISDFGEGLAAFGQSLVAYNTSVSGLDLDAINSTTTSVQSLIDLATNAEGLDASGLLNLNTALTNLATTGITDFCNAFLNSNMQVSSAIQTMISYGTSAIQNQDSSYKAAGTESAMKYAEGLNNSASKAKTAGLTVANGTLIGLQKFYAKDYSTGNTSGEKYSTGVSNKQSAATSAGKALGAAALAGVKQYTSSFRSIGENAGQGFVEGLRSKLNAARAVASQLASVTTSTTAKGLDERSPSHIMFGIGDYAGLGYINGLMYYVSVASKTGEEIGDNTVTGIEESLESGVKNINTLDKLADSTITQIVDLDVVTDPIITPRVDSSYVTESISSISDMFDDVVSRTYDMVANVDYNYANSKDAMIDNISQTLKASNSANVGLMNDLINAVNSGETDVNVQVKLQGDAAGVFKLVKEENNKAIKSANYNPLARTTVSMIK